MIFKVKFAVDSKPLNPRQTGMARDGMGYPGGGRGDPSDHLAIGSSGHPKAESSIPLNPTPNWDDLGCSGIPREGEGAHRVIGESGDRVIGDLANPRQSGITRFLAVLLVLLAIASFGQQPAKAVVPEGIPRELARERAQRIKDVRYRSEEH